MTTTTTTSTSRNGGASSSRNGSRREAGLGDQPAGSEVQVERVDGDDLLAKRLWDMGFWPGTRVHVVRHAPFGGPSQFRMRGYRLVLRRDEAARVRVWVERQR